MRGMNCKKLPSYFLRPKGEGFKVIKIPIPDPDPGPRKDSSWIRILGCKVPDPGSAII
jgi:hypothetical protein